MVDNRSAGGVDFLPAADALYRDAQWAYACEHRVLGHRVVCRSNSRYVCDLFDEAFGVCGQTGAAEADTLPPAECRSSSTTPLRACRPPCRCGIAALTQPAC